MHPNVAIVGRGPNSSFLQGTVAQKFSYSICTGNCLDLISVSESLVTVVLTLMAMSVFNSIQGKNQLCGLINFGISSCKYCETEHCRSKKGSHRIMQEL